MSKKAEPPASSIVKEPQEFRSFRELEDFLKDASQPEKSKRACMNCGEAVAGRAIRCLKCRRRRRREKQRDLMRRRRQRRNV